MRKNTNNIKYDLTIEIIIRYSVKKGETNERRDSCYDDVAILYDFFRYMQ